MAFYFDHGPWWLKRGIWKLQYGIQWHSCNKLIWSLGNDQPSNHTDNYTKPALSNLLFIIHREGTITNFDVGVSRDNFNYNWLATCHYFFYQLWIITLYTVVIGVLLKSLTILAIYYIILCKYQNWLLVDS